MVNDSTRFAREIIQKRLGRDLGPIKTMPKDTRKAVYLLALQLQKGKTYAIR